MMQPYGVSSYLKGPLFLIGDSIGVEAARKIMHAAQTDKPHEYNTAWARAAIDDATRVCGR